MTERQKKREACYELLDIVVSGFHMYGEIYIPGRSRGESFPCICLFHGFPGVTGNDDLAQYFMRQGFVVFRPYHRGAWGSEGYYSFTGAVEDALLKDARENYRQLDIEDAVVVLKDRNLYLIEGKYDEIAFPEQYVYPFWEKLSEYQTDAVRRLETLPASHDFPECRQILAEKIADWLEKEELQ